MKKFCVALIALSVFVLSGCGGGGSSSVSEPIQQISPEVKQVVFLNSPALEFSKRYRIYKGAKLSGMNGAKYYVSNTGSESVQSVLVLGFSEALSADESFIVVNYAPDYETHSGSVVFAYDPSAGNENFTSGGNIAFTGGNMMRYTTLSLEENSANSDTKAGYYTVSPNDVEIYAEYPSLRGTTTFARGGRTAVTFIPDNEADNTPREIPSSGNVMRLVRKVNTFSGIVSEY